MKFRHLNDSEDNTDGVLEPEATTSWIIQCKYYVTQPARARPPLLEFLNYFTNIPYPSDSQVQLNGSLRALSTSSKFMPPSTMVGGVMLFTGHPSGCPAVVCPLLTDLSLLLRSIVPCECYGGWHTFRWRGDEAHLFCDVQN